jgi:hypothetical protein
LVSMQQNTLSAPAPAQQSSTPIATHRRCNGYLLSVYILSYTSYTFHSFTLSDSVYTCCIYLFTFFSFYFVHWNTHRSPLSARLKPSSLIKGSVQR